MVKISEAIERLKTKYPNQRIVSGLDMDDFYAFSMMSRSVNPKSALDMPVQPTMKGIRKNNGEEFDYHIFLSHEGTLKGDIDVTPYLSSEDAAFARRMKTLMGR